MRSIVSGTVLCLALAAIVSCSAPVRRDPANPAEVTHPREEVEFAAILRAEDRRIADADLLDLLGHAEARVRARAATAVARIGAPGARFALEPLLGDDSSEVRAGAAFGLGLLGERESLQALMRSAGDPEPSVRARAAEALGRLGVQEAVDAIGVLLRDPDAEARAEACLAAWKLPDASSAVDGLIEGLGSESAVVRFGASYALGRLAASPFAPPSSGARVGRLSREDALRVREALVDQVASPLPEVRMQVARGLASPGTTREEAAVGTLCADPVPGVRINAIRSFGYPGQRIDPFLSKALRDAHQGVVRAAIESLARVGGPGAAEILAKGIGRSSDRSAWVLEPATIGLAQVAPAATPEIVEGLTLNRDATMRAAVGQILAAGSDSRSQSYAARLLLDPVPKVRAAVVPIVATAPGTLEELLGPVREDPDPVVRAAVAGAAGDRLARTDLPEKDRREAISVVQRIWALSAPDALPDARVAALEAIAKGGPSEDARTMLDSGLASTDRLTRLRAIDLVRELYAEDRSALAGPAAERPLDDYLEILHWASRPRAAIVTVERRGFAPGRFTIRLETMLAPLASWNFAQLAESGFYDGLEVHRVVPNFVVQDGDPRGDGYGGPGHTIRDEFGPEHFWAGSVGMASAGRDTAGSQWFVTLAAQPHLDGRYTLFGRVVQNLDGVVAQIVPGDKVVSITTYEGDGTEPLPPR